MSSATCGTESPAGAKFCNGCGASLARSCPACGTSNGRLASVSAVLQQGNV